MRLFIAEKPSLGKAIAAVLPKPHQSGEGCITAANGDVVSWCIGHLLEQVDPEHYDANLKRWQLETLPIVPEKWALKPKTKTRKQLTVLKKLIKQASELVHAGDPDREGQLLVDEVIDFAGVSNAKKRQVKRCLISDLNPSAVKRAVAQLQDNQNFVPLSVSALARTRADWLYGINLTRAYTVQGKKAGFDGLLSVGRVQTPVLGLVVRRDIEIEEFVSKPFYEVLADIQTSDLQTTDLQNNSGELFKAKWQPSEACQPYMDEEGRVLVKALAENVAGRITNKPATVTKFDKKPKKQAPPLPYNLSALQIDAAKRFNMDAKRVLDTCQSLYERHKLLTYPRSESRYLPNEHYAEGQSVIAAIANNCAAMNQFASRANPQIKSKAFNDAKVTAHHAIIPTKKQSNASLSNDEANIYELVSRQYLAQFFPHHEYDETKLALDIEGGVFTASAKQVTKLGWKEMFPASKKRAHNAQNDSENEDEQQVNLPVLKVGDVLHSLQGHVIEKNTQPPQHFTDATLLAAMTGIARYVKDPEIRKILKETDGLGTEATRAGIIELLFKRQFLTKKGKSIMATPTGRGLVAALPEVATRPDLTAQWESMLAKICDKQVSYQNFMTPMIHTMSEMVQVAKDNVPTHLAGLSGMRGGNKPRGKSGYKKGGYKKGGYKKSTYKKKS